MKAKLFYPSVNIRRPTQMRAARFVLPVLLICLALILVSSTAQAHGIGYYQIRGAYIDPYTVHVWVAPGLLRTGIVHIDTAVFDADDKPAVGTLVQVSFVPLDGEGLPLVVMAGSPAAEYPHARGATFTLKTPGLYRLEVMVSDTNGASGITSAAVEVTTIRWPVKVAIALIFVGSAASGVWLLLLTRAFWMGRVLNRSTQLQRLRVRKLATHGRFKTTSMTKSFRYGRGELSFMSETEGSAHPTRSATLMQRLNGQLHAPALWVFMLIIVAHWLEHVLQIYQIYALGWAPSTAGGILGVIYPQLIESESLHFFYDFVQWAGIVILRSGFQGRARTIWTLALVIQTWHYIEHVLLMGQYLTGHFLFGAPHQISILQLWFPRAELHFVYNLLVFIPMVIAVHYYVKPKLIMLAALRAEPMKEQA